MKKVLSVILLIVGLLGLLASILADTLGLSVSGATTSWGPLQTAGCVVGGLLALAGFLLLLLGRRKQPRNVSTT